MTMLDANDLYALLCDAALNYCMYSHIDMETVCAHFYWSYVSRGLEILVPFFFQIQQVLFIYVL